jgi:hypothetical protein
MDVNNYLCTFEPGYKSRRNYDENNLNSLINHKQDYFRNFFFIKSASKPVEQSSIRTEISSIN